jgi:HicA toxin of bacterial toxin-antitoxin,
MERVLQRLGFARVRQKGSHVFYRHADGRTTTVTNVRCLGRAQISGTDVGKLRQPAHWHDL